MTIRTTLTAALATLALAAPAAVAQPADMHASTAQAAAQAQQSQDLRSPDARDAALTTKQHESASAVAAKAKRVQDLRSPDAIDAAQHPRKSPVVVNAPGATVVDSQAKSTPVAPGQPTWAVNPQPLTPPQTATATKSDDGTDWTTIAIGVGITLLLVGGIAVLTARTRPTPRTPASV